MKKSVCLMFLGMLLLPQVSHAVPLTAEHLYTFARQKNEKLLDKYSKYIDLTNKNNDTALCISVKQRDRDSFELLKEYGASTKVECLQKMLNKTTPKQDVSSDIVSEGDGEFLGMGLKGWGLTGLAVAGVAAASGGGGGSSSGSNITEDEESVVLNCINGIQVGDACQCNAGYIGELCENKAECNGYYQTCPDGYEKGNNTCQSGEDLLYKCDIEIECSYTTTSCQDGYHETGNTCKSGEITYVECDIDECIGFDYTSCPMGYSASATCKSGETFKYQCDNCAEGYSKDASGNCIRVKGADVIGTKSSINDSVIEIENTEYRDVYGMYRVTSDVVYNTDASYGVINIKNISDGNVYGIYANSIVYNSSAYYSGGATGKIIISNIGDGNIYGIYSEGNIYNARTYLSNALGTSKSNASINIKNDGNGNVFGLYSLSSAYNANEIRYEKRTTSGKIEIVNNGLGRGVAIYALNAYNQSSKGQESIIRMANINNGVTIGMFGKEILENSGSISIHNLGKGTAIGLYANGGIASNSGNIIITRDEYIDNKATDEASDDETYTASTEKGGLAIGIYGASGSDITNSGTITITGAETSYGIYAEDDTVTVSNTGTISIDGDTNHANAIELNGGKLFQDGELVAQNLALNDFGGEVIASSNSKFVAEDKISGDLSVSADVVQNGFDKTYTSKDVISAKDVKNRNRGEISHKLLTIIWGCNKMNKIQFVN